VENSYWTRVSAREEKYFCGQINFDVIFAAVLYLSTYQERLREMAR
jgi:hypothetical protein